MTTRMDRIKHRLPRVAVIVHDLLMVWLCWQGLHYLRYAMQPTQLDLVPFTSTPLVELASMIYQLPPSFTRSA